MNLLVFGHVPVARTAQLIADVTGARPSTGWISSVASTVADLLVDFEKLIKSLITLAHVIHVDETTSNTNGARWRLHIAGTEKLTGAATGAAGAPPRCRPAGRRR